MSPRSAAWGLLPALVLATPLHGASGTDAGFGYVWRDTASGATYRSLTPDVPMLRSPGNDVPPERVDLDLSGAFPFYGGAYVQAWISENGWISFVDPGTDSHPVRPGTIPDGAFADPDAVIAAWWSDLRGADISYGSIAAEDAWMVRWSRAADTINGGHVTVECILWADGLIQLQYERDRLDVGEAAVGIEAETILDGVQIAAGGVVHPGVVFVDRYAIELQRSVLSLQCAGIPPIDCDAVSSDSLPGTLAPAIDRYGCSVSPFGAAERVHRISLAEPSTVQLDLAGGPDLRAFLLSECNENRCLRGPFTSDRTMLAAGDYWIAVDAPTPAGEGPYDLSVSCTPAGPAIACESTASGMTTLGGAFGPYPCSAPRSHADGEIVHVLDLPARADVRATLVVGAASLDVLVRAAGTSRVIDESACIAWGDDQAIAWDVPPGQHLVVVDGDAGIATPFELQVSCVPRLDCTSPAGVIDLAGLSVASLAGDTTPAPNLAEEYACEAGAPLSGGEHVYRLDLPQPGRITLLPTAGNQRYLILDECREGTCLGEDRCSLPLEAGQHVLVVDGVSSGPYAATLFFESPVPGHWTDCVDPLPPTTAGDTESVVWFLDSPGPPCPRAGCTFVMYATVPCGKELHLPFYDMESARVRIFDVLRGVPVELTARSTGGFFQRGLEIQWEDCSGGNPLWNEQTTEILTEVGCSVYRIEMEDMGSGPWELLANCTGERGLRQFTLYDTLCHALEGWSPLPDLGLVDVSAAFNCPEVTITYTIENAGCAPATDVEVVVFEDAARMGSDVVASIGAGETFTATFTATLSGSGGSTMVAVDPSDASWPNGRILECTEVPASGCGLGGMQELIPIPPCVPPCVVAAAAFSFPDTICLGGRTLVDASASVFTSCPDGVLYHLTGPGVDVTQRTPVFADLQPLATATYDVEVYCEAMPTCSDVARVVVVVEPLPDFASVTARDIVSCAPNLHVEWTPATFPGGGGGAYSVYVSDVSCADAIARGPSMLGLLGTDVVLPTSPGTYYVVVAAVDAVTGCASFVAADDGACTAITDVAVAMPEGLPRIGPRLRLGGDDGAGATRYGRSFVELRWGLDRPLDIPSGEHVHVLRSRLPDSGFSLLAPEPPFVVTGSITDTDAVLPPERAPAWYYVVLAADACENDNADHDEL